MIVDSTRQGKTAIVLKSKDGQKDLGVFFYSTKDSRVEAMQKAQKREAEILRVQNSYDTENKNIHY